MRKLLWAAAAFSLGVFGAVYLLPPALLLPLGLCALAAGGGCVLLRRKRRILGVCLALFGLAAGLLWTGGAYVRQVRPAAALDGREGTFTALVTGWPRESSYGGYAVEARLTAAGLTRRALLYLDGEDLETLPRPGDTLSGRARFRLANRLRGEESDYYYSRGIWLTASVRDTPELLPAGRIPWSLRPVWWARRWQGALASALPDAAAGLVTALVTGDKSGLEGPAYSAFQRVGLAHVVAVSGLHVSFLCGFALRVLGKHRRRTAAVSLVLMVLFAAMAGFVPSVVRAVIMQALLLLAPLLGREADTPTSLALALALILLQNPYAAASLGLQLSFASVAGIVCVSPALYRRFTAVLPPKPRRVRAGLCSLWRGIAGSVSTTLGALIFTTPITAVTFGTLSLVSPVANLLTLWAVSLAFGGGFLVGAAALFSPALAQVLGAVCALPARYVLWMAGLLSRLPLAAVSLDGVFLRLWLALVYLLLLLGFLWRREGSRLLLPACAGSCTLCLALTATTALARQSPLTFTVLDVGQGQSVAITTPRQSVLVDCGGNRSADAGDIAADYLQSAGHTRLDVLVLTHFHADHAGGVKELLARMEVGLLIAPDVTEDDPLRREILDLARAAGTEVDLLRENTVLTLEGAELTLYRPLGAGDANEEGLSVLCSRGETDALITGDMDAIIEGRLVKYGDLPDLEILVAGHHGSRYAASQVLLEATRPEYAAVSVGYNTYGHPAWETLSRLDRAGCAIYTTQLMGHISFHIA